MGEVWRAEDRALRRSVALKILSPEHGKSPSSIARFEREIQATASIAHPNVVRIHDWGITDDGVWYYAMDLLEGSDLASVVPRCGPVPPALVVHLGVPVAHGLAEAHRKGRHPPRSQARQHLRDRTGGRAAAPRDPRFRDRARADRDRVRAHPGGLRDGYARLHGARGESRRARQRRGGPLRPRRDALLRAHRCDAARREPRAAVGARRRHPGGARRCDRPRARRQSVAPPRLRRRVRAPPRRRRDHVDRVVADRSRSPRRGRPAIRRSIRRHRRRRSRRARRHARARRRYRPTVATPRRQVSAASRCAPGASATTHPIAISCATVVTLPIGAAESSASRCPRAR